MNEKYNIIVSLIGGILGYLFGGMDMLLQVFVTILVLDTVSGMFKGYITGTYSSKKFRDGLLKKSGYMFAVILAVQLDKVTGDVGALRSALLLCFVANEATSIIENLGEIGVPFPPQITDAIAILRNKSEEKNSRKNKSNKKDKDIK